MRGSTSYHFVRDLTQRCWRSTAGPVLWVNEIVHCPRWGSPVRIVRFLRVADAGWNRLEDCPVHVVVRLGEFRCLIEDPDVAVAGIGPFEEKIVSLAEIYSFQQRNPRSLVACATLFTMSQASFH
jgi:hypothetical protein